MGAGSGDTAGGRYEPHPLGPARDVERLGWRVGHDVQPAESELACDGLPPADNPSKAWDLTATGMDMPFFDAMLAQMSADYCVDPARIFVAGQSYGGLMTNAVGCLRGDVVRAIAVVAGSGPQNTSPCARTTSTFDAPSTSSGITKSPPSPSEKP